MYSINYSNIIITANEENKQYNYISKNCLKLSKSLKPLFSVGKFFNNIVCLREINKIYM